MLLLLFYCCFQSSCIIANLSHYCNFVLCCYSSLHTLLPHMLLFCALHIFSHFASHALLFSHVDIFACCFSHTFEVLTSPSSILVFLCFCFFCQHGNSPPLLAMCKLEIEGWSSHTKGALFFFLLCSSFSIFFFFFHFFGF